MGMGILDFYQAKSKYRWSSIDQNWTWLLTYMVLLLCLFALTESGTTCGENNCLHGECKNSTSDKCVCEHGWIGPSCDRCGGRIRLNSTEGYITDGVGNYTLNTKCSWLLEGPVNASIQLQLDHFATECSWDHLYVYDGNSIFAPRIAAFSGLVITDSPVNKSLPRVTARSGSVYLHFFSDAAYNMSGFNISYTVRGCPLNCSGHGWCRADDQVCQCESNYTGDACHIRLCPNNCGGKGICRPSSRGNHCECKTGYRGASCEMENHQGVWGFVIPPARSFVPSGRASHKSVVHNGDLWVVSGEQFGGELSENVVRYNFHNERWDSIPVSQVEPEQRYGHSLVFHQDALYMYGGLKGKIITNELWRFDMNSYEWALVVGRPNSTGRAVVGHTAHVIDGIMYVIFGHSPVYGYMNSVQEYNMSAGSWSVDNSTKGAIVKGGYGHSSVFDAGSNLIYVHAGYHSVSVSNYHLSDSLYSYDPKEKHWRILRSSGQYKYLHSAVIISDLMLVFGGNTHNDTSKSQGAKCYSADFLAYDMKCDRWYKLATPKMDQAISRFGHIAEVHDRKMFVFGGFNGLMLNDMYMYQPGSCKALDTKESCLAAREGVKCVWTGSQGCLLMEEAEEKKGKKIISSYETAECEPIKDGSGSKCSEFDTCPSCVETTYPCTWCDDRCLGSKCGDNEGGSESSECKDKYSSECNKLHNCQACESDMDCEWEKTEKVCAYRSHGGLMKMSDTSDNHLPCKPSCHVHQTCENCTAASCMWCSNQQRCVESNSYVASFPYGQCMEWTTQMPKCPATRCSELSTCEVCQANPACGWCDDISNTGLGTCMEGGNSGPIEVNGTTPVLKLDKCPADRWYFTECPLCQCNGHSTCKEGTNTCEACKDLTTGSQCEHCKDGYFGNPINGGNCSVCECNGQADKCNHKTGVCYCRTRGMIGDHCDQCDEAHKYFGNPKGGGTCYYDLTTDYQFTFNLSKEDDKYYTQINFMNVPEKPDRDVDFNINCSEKALMNITVKTKSQPYEMKILENHQCKYFKMKLYHKEYIFGQDANTTFYVSLYDFKTPFWLQISFSQFQQIDLVHFFVTFFSCFLSLLLLAAISWKVRQRFTHYRHRQRMVVELEQMAARPFATCAIEVPPPNEVLSLKKEPPDQRGSRRKKAHNNKLNKPSPIAMEPLHGHRAALLALVVRLPTGDEDYTPPGQSGIAIASALVTLGNPRKASVEHSKGEKNKARKLAAQNPENCI